MRVKFAMAAATAALAVAAASGADAATVVYSVYNGALTSANAIGTILGVDAHQGNTYDWNFTVGGTGPAELVLQLQGASLPSGIQQNITFDLCSGVATTSSVCNSSTANFVQQSPTQPGSSFSISLNPGSYFVQLPPAGIAKSIELVSGSLQLLSVPEPATWAMGILGLGLIGLGARRRRASLTLA